MPIPEGPNPGGSRPRRTYPATRTGSRLAHVSSRGRRPRRRPQRGSAHDIREHAAHAVNTLGARRLEETVELGHGLVSGLSGAGVLVTDVDLTILAAEGDAFDGLAVGGIVGRQVRDVIPAVAWDVLGPRYAAALAGRAQSFDYDATARTATYRLRMAPVQHEGFVIGLMVLAEDVTGERDGASASGREPADAAVGPGRDGGGDHRDRPRPQAPAGERRGGVDARPGPRGGPGGPGLVALLSLAHSSQRPADGHRADHARRREVAPRRARVGPAARRQRRALVGQLRAPTGRGRGRDRSGGLIPGRHGPDALPPRPGHQPGAPARGVRRGAAVQLGD